MAVSPVSGLGADKGADSAGGSFAVGGEVSATGVCSTGIGAGELEFSLATKGSVGGEVS